MGVNKHSSLSKILIFFFIWSSATTAYAQGVSSWYLVSFTNKKGTPYTLSNPSQYLSERAIARRQKNSIAIDSSDLPINPAYIDSIKSIGVEVYHQSRWLNAALVFINDSAEIRALNKSSIVDSIAFMAPYQNLKLKKHKARKHKSRKHTIDKGEAISTFSITSGRIDMVDLQPLMNMGYRGKGIQIAVLDNGFSNANTMAAFAPLFANGQILAVRNFTSDGKKVFSSGSHGTMVLSTMAAFVEGEFTGSAIGASYYLIQTEDNRSEFPVEEANWLFGAEFVDSLGTDIITTSLGYTHFDSSQYNHWQGQLNGKTAIVSRAAQMATQKGILVFCSAGNEGAKPWRKISFPADAQGAITVGAVDDKEQIASFSSVGYSADGRVKPDLVALGYKAHIVSPQGKIFKANGTSFSTPFLAGAAATLWQVASNATAAKLRQAILKSARRYNNPDSIYGYGLPDFYLASILLQIDTLKPSLTKENVLILPNPFNSSFYILFTATKESKAEIALYDINGKQVWFNNSFQTKKGKNFLQINELSNLAQGMYILKITVDGLRISKKVIKQ